MTDHQDHSRHRYTSISSDDSCPQPHHENHHTTPPSSASAAAANADVVEQPQQQPHSSSPPSDDTPPKPDGSKPLLLICLFLFSIGFVVACVVGIVRILTEDPSANDPKFHLNSVSVSAFHVSPFNPHIISGNWTVTFQVDTGASNDWAFYWRTSKPFIKYHDGSPVVSRHNIIIDPQSDEHINAKVELVTFVMVSDSYQPPLFNKTAYSLISDLMDGGVANFTVGVKGELVHQDEDDGVTKEGRFSVTCEQVRVQFSANNTSNTSDRASGSLLGEPTRCGFSYTLN